MNSYMYKNKNSLPPRLNAILLNTYGKLFEYFYITNVYILECVTTFHYNILYERKQRVNVIIGTIPRSRVNKNCLDTYWVMLVHSLTYTCHNNNILHGRFLLKCFEKYINMKINLHMWR